MQIRIDGKSVSVRMSRDAGGDTRPAVVCIHGAGGNKTHWLGQFRALGEAARVVLVDLPGHGGSDGSPCESVEEYAAFMRALLAADELELENRGVVLAGHSLGGAVAMEVALGGYPAAGLVLAATGARLRVMPAFLEAMRNSEPADWIDMVGGMLYGPGVSDEALTLMRRELLATPGAVFANDFTAADRWDAMSRVGDIDVPTLVVSGTADQMTPEKYARFLAQTIPGAALHLIEGVGHMPMLENPDGFNAALLSFVRSLPSREPDGGAMGA